MKLVDSIEMNTKHYVEIMARAVDNVLPQPSEEVKYETLLLASKQHVEEKRRRIKWLTGRVASKTTF